MSDKDLSTKETGRPTLQTESLLKKLEEIFKVGGTVAEACSVAMITEQTYYRWMRENKDLVMRMDSARHYADVMAKKNVTKAIIHDKDIATSKWWLEKREFKDAKQLNQFNIKGDMKLDFIEGEYASETPQGTTDSSE